MKRLYRVGAIATVAIIGGCGGSSSPELMPRDESLLTGVVVSS